MTRELNVNRSMLFRNHLRGSALQALLLVLTLSLAACQTSMHSTTNSCQAQGVTCSKHRQAEHDTEVAYADQNKHSLRSFICENAAIHQSSSVGDGHCVALIRRCSNTPKTALWRPGRQVVDNKLRPGTVIATFDNGRYPNTHGHHAAIFINQDERGIWVWDQWLGKPVHRRLIRYRNSISGTTPANTAQDYRVVLAAK